MLLENKLDRAPIDTSLVLRGHFAQKTLTWLELTVITGEGEGLPHEKVRDACPLA